MPYNPTTGVFTRVDNSFSDPVPDTPISSEDATSLFNDYDAGLSDIPGISSTFIQAGTGALTRTMQAKVRETISITDFGAVAGGSPSANSVAIQDALTEAAAINAALYIPGNTSTYQYDTTITFITLVPIYGDGMDQSVLEYTGTGVGMLIQPKAVSAPIYAYLGHYLRDFTIQPSSDLAGTYGIHVELLSGRIYANYDWNCIRVGRFGTKSVWLDNTVGNANGFYTGVIHSCQISNGVDGVSLGDSVFFNYNKIHGISTCSFSQIPGARRLTLAGNNITTTGGISFNPVGGLDFYWNQMVVETTFDYNGASGALLYVAGASLEVDIRDNFIGKITPGIFPTDCIKIDGTTSNVSIDNNRLAKGSSTHVNATSGTTAIVVGANNTFDVSPVIVLAGTNSYYTSLPWPVSTGGSGANLSTTGGAAQVVRQATVGGAFTVSQLSAGELGTIAARTVLGNATNAAANPGASAAGTANQIYSVNAGGTALQFGAIDLSATAAVGTSILARSNGGLGYNASASALASNGSPIGVYSTAPVVVNFNVANTDTSLAVSIPTGFTRYRIGSILIYGASTSLTTATAGVFTQASGVGIPIVTAASSITVATSSADTNNNMQSLTIATSNTLALDITTLFFRVANPQGSAATGSVVMYFFPIP